jgi:ABC-type Fe3+-siderophore transport system permease subunit
VGYRNWTLVLGCSAFGIVAAIAAFAGASLTTAAYRSVVAALIGGILGFLLDYLVAHANVGDGPTGGQLVEVDEADGTSPAESDRAGQP